MCCRQGAVKAPVAKIDCFWRDLQGRRVMQQIYGSCQNGKLIWNIICTGSRESLLISLRGMITHIYLGRKLPLISMQQFYTLTQFACSIANLEVYRLFAFQIGKMGRRACLL